MFTIIRRACTKTFGEKLHSNYFKINSFSSIYSNPRSVEPFYGLVSQRHVLFCRYKSKTNTPKDKKSESESEESNGDFFDEIQDKHTKVIKVNLTSMRLDMVLKSALGLSRNKLDNIFYDSKIRVNGEKVLKKSMHLQAGDEVDVIKGVNIENKDFLTVARVEILTVAAKEESISVKIRRCKALTVENYEGRHRWQE